MLSGGDIIRKRGLCNALVYGLFFGNHAASPHKEKRAMRNLVVPTLALCLWLAPAAWAEEGAAAEEADIANTCAPWDGAATAILLKKSDIRANIYSALDPGMLKGKPKQFTAAPGEPRNGGAEILVCDDKGGRCDPRAGTITLISEGGGLFPGHIDWMDGKEEIHLPFQGKYIHKPMFCG
jgi:hypothetical protein